MKTEKLMTCLRSSWRIVMASLLGLSSRVRDKLVPRLMRWSR